MLEPDVAPRAGKVPPALATVALEPPLSERELQVLRLAAEGLTDREIGSVLFITAATVKTHIKTLLAKLSARGRAHAVAIGFRRGILV